MKKLERVFNEIMSSDMFRLDGEAIDLPEKVIELVDEIKEDEDECKWYIGEGGECCLDDFIVGAYWAFTEWHGGQSSIEYQALSALGDIFSPGMSSLNEEGSEYFAYEQCCEWFNNKYNKGK